jgi:tRNA-Thr(GGU) m(6)t(6)A37 methyltransferase TsaA
MSAAIELQPVGHVQNDSTGSQIVLLPEFTDALMGLDGFSHIYVLYWLHENDQPQHRRTLRVHPRGDAANPLTGVFATHSPKRPNLVALTLCRILTVGPDRVAVTGLDARDGSPIIDIKCYIPHDVDPATVRLPDWV